MGVRVGVIDDHEVFRRGLLACLVEDPLLDVFDMRDSLANAAEVDVVVTSSGRALSEPLLPAPGVVCYSYEAEALRLSTRADVVATLARRSLTPPQLIAAVHAAAAGLRVNCESAISQPISDRSRDVLRLLAGGADTREISTSLGYSERTIKASIAEVQTVLGTRNRTHAVAEAVRANLI